MSTIYHAAIPVDLAAPSRQRIGAAQFFMGDNDSHVFTALVADTDAPEAGLRAGTVSGTALRADGVTVALEGTKGADVQEVTFPNGITAQATPCSVTLPQAAFAVPGSLLISIKLTDGTTATTVLAISGTVIRTETDAAVDPGEILPDLAELQAAAANALAAAEDATEAAEAASAFSGLLDETRDNEREVIVSGTYSGTQAGRVYADFPAGTYRIDVDSVTSSDTDASVSVFYFMNGSTDVGRVVLPRNQKAHEYITISSAATSILLFAATAYAQSAGDTYTYTGLTVSKDYPLARFVSNTGEVFEKVFDISRVSSNFFAGAVDLPEGDYVVEVDTVYSADTDSTTSLLSFVDSSNVSKLSLTVLRNTTTQTRYVHMPSGVTGFRMYAGDSTAVSTSDALACGGIRIWRVNRKFLTDNSIPTPDGFGWEGHPLEGHLFRTEKGIECDLDVRTLRRATGKTYYVSPTGSDSNAGTSSSAPLQSIATAMNKSDAVFVVVMNGFFTADLVPQHLSNYAKSISVIAASDAHPVLSTNTGAHTFTKTGGQTYVYETAVVSNAVWDITNEIPYAWVDSVAEVDSTEASYYSDGTKTYVHTKGSGAPDENIRCCPAADNFRVTASGAITLYLEGLAFCGGENGALRVTTDGTNRPTVYAKDCTFVGGTTWGACYLEGCEAVLQNCEACYSRSDGFGIHKKNNPTTGPSPRQIEINCHGHHNGIAGNTTTNGSTAHAAGHVIRVNGSYHHNAGPNVADTHEGTRSWNLGCVAYKSLRSSGSSDFVISTGDAWMWLDTCAGYSSTYSLVASTSTKAFVRNCAFVSIDISGAMESY